MQDQNQNHEQQRQSVDVEAIVAKALYQCQGQITQVVGFMFKEHEAIIAELKKYKEVIDQLQKENNDLKEKLKTKK